jgi:putative membrane protein
MSKLKMFLQQFHWKILLIRILVNGVALILTALLIPDIYFVTPTFRSVLILSIVLGILNAILKPVILLLIGQFIFATFGLLVILIDTLILYILARWFPDILIVNSFWWALIGGVVLGLTSNALENLLGLTPPIVPEENPELRKRIEAEQQATLANLIAKKQPVVHHDVETQSVSDVSVAKAILDVLEPATAPGDTSSPVKEEIPEPGSQPLDESKMQGSEPLEPKPDDKTDHTQPGGA